MFDLYAITHREYSNFVRGRMSEDEDDAFLARVTGLTQDEVSALSLGEWKRLIAGLHAAVSVPVEDDPKSVKESTSA
jgi:hypothetical protein